MDDNPKVPTGFKFEQPAIERPVDRDHSDMQSIGTDIAQRQEPPKPDSDIPSMGAPPIAN